jgi:hypothetical protein
LRVESGSPVDCSIPRLSPYHVVGVLTGTPSARNAPRRVIFFGRSSVTKSIVTLAII